jgi:lytic murein transglycosylase
VQQIALRREWEEGVRAGSASLVRSTAAAVALAVPFALPHSASGADCGHDGTGFAAWLARFKVKAAGQGISQATLSSALSGVSYDRSVIALDRSVRAFKLSFEHFYARRVSSALIRKGQRLLALHRQLLDRIEKRYGVPGSVLIAIWGLETNFGAIGSGGRSILASVATLAYDCRRPDFFRNELISALRIIDRGDMSVSQLRGGWAGEIGPMQFLPSSYYKYAVDFDGDGRKDLIHSVPDMLASTANFLKAHGWRPNEPWTPGSANYAALQQWNKAEVYARTIAVVATRMGERR